MPRSFTNLLFHFIWATKGRHPWLTDDIRPRLHAYLGGIVRKLNGAALEINGFTEHVHGLVRLHPDCSVSELARTMKANSSKWIHETFPELRDFAWQSGYTALSVSQSGVEKLRTYIQRQVEHHRAVPFDQEIREFLRRNGMDPDAWTDD